MMRRILKGDTQYLERKRKLRSEMTRAENQLWLRLRGRQFGNLKFRRQHGIGSYIVDFYCPERSFVIEVDGDVHAESYQKLKDQEREEDLMSLGAQVVRYTNEEVLCNMDGVLEDLRCRLLSESTSPHPSLQRRGTVGFLAAIFFCFFFVSPSCA